MGNSEVAPSKDLLDTTMADRPHCRPRWWCEIHLISFKLSQIPALFLKKLFIFSVYRYGNFVLLMSCPSLVMDSAFH